MTDYSPAGFGRAVQKKREALELQQEEFGTRVGYKAGTGAAVSVSRIETGRTLPPAARRTAIARELRLSLEELETLAAEETRALASKPSVTTATPPRKQSVRERAEILHQRVERRKVSVESLGEDFFQAHQAASETFYLPFMELAKTIEGAKTPPAPAESELEVLDKAHTPAALAEIKVRTLQAELGYIIAGMAAGTALGGILGGLGAYGIYQGVARFGAASTGIENRFLTGIALQNSVLARIGGGTLSSGGGGVQAGVSRLVASVAIPALIGAVAGGILADQRRRKEVARINTEFDAIEAELDATKPGIKKLQSVLPRATDALNYIGVHATHAFEKWKRGMGEPPHTWNAMSGEQKKRFEELLEVAACELAIVGLETGQYLDLRGKELEEFSMEVDAIISYTDDRLRTLV